MSNSMSGWNNLPPPEQTSIVYLSAERRTHHRDAELAPLEREVRWYAEPVCDEIDREFRAALEWERATLSILDDPYEVRPAPTDDERPASGGFTAAFLACTLLVSLASAVGLVSFVVAASNRIWR